MVGNGNSSARSNAYTLDQMGNGWFSGDVYVGSTSGTHKDTGSVKLAKETQLLPSIADAHWTDAAREFIFADKPVGTYLVHNGSEAMNMFANMCNLDKDKQKELKNSLLKYCELDTYAMVKIFYKLKEVTS